jgi:glycosyltransferase involved in cell wall biosynthesis
VSAAPSRPRVSAIIPARNEADHIGACIRSIVTQQVSGGLEVIVADGRSSDETARLAREAGAMVVDNPQRITPAGLNAALAAARGDIVVRFDAHAEMPPGYVEASVQALDEEPGAVGVGGWRQIDASGPWGSAIAAALASRFGIGNPRLWRRPAPGEGRTDVDTFNLGAWRAEDLRAQGGWSERLIRNQDFELNYRLRHTGGRIVFDPAIWSIYHPRESLRAIARQYWDYGRFKALMISTHPRSLEPRQLGPVGLLAAAIAAVVPSRLGAPARAALAAYFGVLAIVATRGGGGWRTLPVLATIHTAWGTGLLAGFAARLTPGRSVRDGSVEGESPLDARSDGRPHR